MIKLSIIIVNFNAGIYLNNCIESILKSSLSSSFYEIIVVDNDSADNSMEFLSKFKAKNLKIINNDKNYGFAKANNIGIKSSIGQYILLLNPDTLLNTSTLKVMLDIMEKDKNIGVSTCKVKLPGGQLDDACHRGFPTPWNAFCYFFGLARLFPKSKFFNGYHLGYCDLDKVHEIDSCVGAFMLIRRSVGESLNWLDEDYFWYGEDIDFCYRVKLSNWKVIYNPYTEIIHHKGITSGLKSHSTHKSTASIDTKRLATNARFDVMKIFYRKHYQNIYPKLINSVILIAIEVKRKISFLNLKI